MNASLSQTFNLFDQKAVNLSLRRKEIIKKKGLSSFHVKKAATKLQPDTRKQRLQIIIQLHDKALLTYRNATKQYIKASSLRFLREGDAKDYTLRSDLELFSYYYLLE